MKLQHFLTGILAILVLSGYLLGQGGWTDDETVVRLTTSTDDVGIGTTDPNDKLDVAGPITVRGDQNDSPSGTGYTSDEESIRLTGSTSDYIISTQDGSGRIQHYWNSTTLSTSNRYLVSGEVAWMWNLNLSSDPYLEFKWAPSGSAGGTINWQTHMAFDIDGNVGIGTTNPSAKLDILDAISMDHVDNFPAEGSVYEGDWNTYIVAGTGTDGRTLRLGTSNDGYTSSEIELQNYNRWDGSKIFFKTASISETAPETRMFINYNGRVGIGTTSPTVKLEIEDTSAPTVRLEATSGNQVNSGTIIFSESSDGDQFTITHNGSTNLFKIRTSVVDNVLVIPRNTGNVGIGTTTIPSGYKLAVDGKIIAEEVQVEMSGSWPDHVFAESYRLRPLDEVETYIKEHNHLPDMPSAAEIEENGVSLGEMQATLLQKVEELTLYVIDLKKENEALKERMAELGSR